MPGMIEFSKPPRISVWSEWPWEDNIVVDKVYSDDNIHEIVLTYAEAYGLAKRILDILDSDGFGGDKD